MYTLDVEFVFPEVLSTLILNPLETIKIKAGFSVAVPDGYHAKIVSRSGMSSKGIVVTNAPGIIDSDYRGDICVLLTNIGKQPYKLENKARIAQMFFDKNIKNISAIDIFCKFKLIKLIIYIPNILGRL